jgi:hypothetical protein
MATDDHSAAGDGGKSIDDQVELGTSIDEARLLLESCKLAVETLVRRGEAPTREELDVLTKLLGLSIAAMEEAKAAMRGLFAVA